MAEKKLSSAVIDKYNKDTTDAVTEITTGYSSAKKIAKKVESLFADCSLSLRNQITEGFTLNTIESDLESRATTIKTKLEKAKTTAKNNDTTIKQKMEARSNEVKQLKSIISQYKGNIAGATSLNAPGLASGLKAIGTRNNIDKIPGVFEGRGKRLEQKLKKFKNETRVMTKEQMLKEINSHYRNLSEKEIAVLLEYYLFKAKEISGKNSDKKQALLVIKNGQYEIRYVDLENNVTFFNLETSANADLLNPSGSIDTDILGKTEGSLGSGFGATTSVDLNTMKGKYGDAEWSVGNVSASASLNADGVGASLGANLIEFNFEHVFAENDLYQYKSEIDISLLSAEIKAKLAADGIEMGTPGLVGISVSGGRVELIDINLDF
ncbi:hypothetical protein [Enterococcus rivorum]|uniref:Uncharacterized protein n=1 Tax=Enterococcus rivorum TaxID=762845 RepID=A0A1E5KWJ6_9ENTE|nr:hypothetical protein [Enterococcus rivorum]MBP2099115.1 hypothetical protein [Enterococcus rivorum]OEH82266.1 hypothetical protein BCR26_13530 [Enterococcus rivorum]